MKFVKNYFNNATYFAFLIAATLFCSFTIFAGDLVWNLTDDGRYVVQVHEENGKTVALIKNSRGSWVKTEPKFIEVLKHGLKIQVDGKELSPIIADGVPPETSLSLKNSSDVKVSLYNQDLAHFEKKAGKLSPTLNQNLTGYDVRKFASDETYQKIFKPVTNARPKNKNLFRTDLHTHLAGHLEFDSLMKIGYQQNLAYPVDLLDKLDIKYPVNAVVNGRIPMQNLLDSKEFKDSQGVARLEDAMSIEKSRIRTFLDMEEKYLYRNPITKSSSAFKDMLWEAAKSSKNSGVTYMEQSISNIIDPEALKIANAEVPKIERELGIKMRFLVGLWRHSDPEWNLDEVARIKVMTKSSPYIVGVDFMGHETNSTKELESQFKAIAGLRTEFGPEFQIRAHAGENPLNPANVREAAELGASRVGHGIYIEKDSEALKLDPHTQKISSDALEKLKKAKTIVELNPTSNLALNNLSGDTGVIRAQFEQLKKAGIPVTFGSDGVGMYGGDHLEVRRILVQLGFNEDDFKYVRDSEKAYVKVQEAAVARRRQKILDEGTRVPTIEEREAFVKQQGQQYTDTLAAERKAAQVQRVANFHSDFATKGIQGFNDHAAEFEGKKAIDISGGSQSQFAALLKDGRMDEMKIPEIRATFHEMLEKLDPKKVFFITGGTQFGVEEIFHEEVAKINAKLPVGERGFSIVGVLPEVANASEVFGPAKSGISHYLLEGKNWADFSRYKLDLLVKHGGSKVIIGGKMFVADEGRYLINSGLPINIGFMNGPVGAGTDLAKENPGHAFSNGEDLLRKIVGNTPDEYLRKLAATTVVSKSALIHGVEVKKPVAHTFIKDAPTLAYRIKSDRFEDIPEEIRKHLGIVDKTKYTKEYLGKNIGSVFALQMNGDKPDFYIIGKDTYDAKYAPVTFDEVAKKNGKYFEKVSKQISGIMDSKNKDLIAVLKTTPTEMVKMSDLGYSLDKEITIESPWGEQTKPAGKDAFLVWDDSKKQYYMVNSDVDGRPLSYVETKPVTPKMSSIDTTKNINTVILFPDCGKAYSRLIK